MGDSIRIHIIGNHLVPLVLLLLMLLMAEIGWRLGRHARFRGFVVVSEGASTAMVAIFGLLSLLLAFTFSSAADRYDKHRELIIIEGQAVSTVYQSVDLLSEKDQPALRSLLRQYLDLRIGMYARPIDLVQIGAKVAARRKLETEIWDAARASVKATPFPDKLIAASILGSISTMVDASERQQLTQYIHPPRAIEIFLILLTLIGALLSGYVMGIETKRDWFLATLYVVLMTASFALILDLEYPRVGLINLDQIDQTLVVIRQGM